MSFCFDIKNELAEIRPPKQYKMPLTYGFLLFGRSFSYKRMCIQTTNSAMAQYYVRLLKDVYNVTATVEQGGGKRPTYRALVDNEADRLRILASFDYGVYEGAVNRDMLFDDISASSFVRGAFLSCGNLNDPEKGYRADFSVRDEALAKELQKILSEHYITANLSKRGNGYVVYLSRSEMVINLLTLIGLSDRSLEMIETTIVKGVKNNINRARNCDNANISKTVEASINQRRAIEFLQKTGRLEALPEQLYAAAKLRMDNPDSSLSELCRLSPDPITVSGLNHRLKKLIEIHEEFKT